MNIAAEIFAPGEKHTQEERERMELVLDDLGDAAPGRGPIDLSSGKVTVVLGPQESDAILPPRIVLPRHAKS